MSKSLGNVILIPDAIAKGYSPEEIRYTLVSSRYSQRVSFSWQSFDDSRKALAYLTELKRRLKDAAAKGERVSDAAAHAAHASEAATSERQPLARSRAHPRRLRGADGRRPRRRGRARRPADLPQRGQPRDRSRHDRRRSARRARATRPLRGRLRNPRRRCGGRGEGRPRRSPRWRASGPRREVGRTSPPPTRRGTASRRSAGQSRTPRTVRGSRSSERQARPKVMSCAGASDAMP